MKVYLAARYSTKEQIKLYAEDLRSAGIEVTSSWLEEPHGAGSNLNDIRDQQLTEYAAIDLMDVKDADWLVFFSVDPKIPVARGGRHVEFGYALGLEKNMLVVGPKENIFHYLPVVHFTDNFENAKKFLLEQE